MSRRTDLEEYMHTAYEIIREYERMILTSGRPEERRRARGEVSRHWAYIKDYLAEYQKLVHTPWPDEIAELAAHFAGETPSPVVGPSKAGSPIKTKISERDGKEMVYIPAGAYLYGEDKQKRTLPAFWIDRTPVTNAQYARFVAETGHRPPEHWKGETLPEVIADHPVVWVGWEDAEAYARWAGKELPTEEQWEKAARGTDGRTYPWGDEFDAGRCNTKESNIGGTTPTGLYSPAGDSPYGCADMAGNVWEWAASFYQKGLNPVTCGGSWYDGNRNIVKCAVHHPTGPGVLSVTIGFRCVSPISSSES